MKSFLLVFFNVCSACRREKGFCWDYGPFIYYPGLNCTLLRAQEMVAGQGGAAAPQGYATKASPPVKGTSPGARGGELGKGRQTIQAADTASWFFWLFKTYKSEPKCV